jgi:CheY-specific phosphatase CheX
MLSDDRRETILSVIGSVLEDAAFIFTEAIDPAAGSEPAAIEGVTLSFSGERSGVFRLWAEEGFLKLLAANMLGIEENDADARERRADALREIINIITGNVLTELFGTVAVFELGIPAQADAALREVDWTRADAIRLQAEGNRIVCVVDIKE